MGNKWLLEEVYTNKPSKNQISKQSARPQLDNFKKMSLFDIAEKLNSKPDMYVMDKED